MDLDIESFKKRGIIPAMKKNFYPFLFVACVFVSLSCETTAEPFKVLWGSSTRALEDARIDAVSKIYECEFNDCFNAVLSLERKNKNSYRHTEDNKYDSPIALSAQQESAAKPTDQERQGFDVFMKDRIKALIVVMAIDGSENTTEAGIFFSRYNRSAFKVEVTSLSATAKHKVAEMVFSKLDQQFKEIR